MGSSNCYNKTQRRALNNIIRSDIKINVTPRIEIRSFQHQRNHNRESANNRNNVRFMPRTRHRIIHCQASAEDIKMNQNPMAGRTHMNRHDNMIEVLLMHTAIQQFAPNNFHSNAFVVQLESSTVLSIKIIHRNNWLTKATVSRGNSPNKLGWELNLPPQIIHNNVNMLQ